jgi:hypothetical protein
MGDFSCQAGNSRLAARSLEDREHTRRSRPAAVRPVQSARRDVPRGTAATAPLRRAVHLGAVVPAKVRAGQRTESRGVERSCCEPAAAAAAAVGAHVVNQIMVLS